jgi:hypothetical protein
MLRGRLPSSEQIRKRHGPSNGMCALCGVFEDLNHIFFHCALAKFMWSCVRDLLRDDWNLAGARDLLAILQNLSGQTCKIV